MSADATHALSPLSGVRRSGRMPIIVAFSLAVIAVVVLSSVLLLRGAGDAPSLMPPSTPLAEASDGGGEDVEGSVAGSSAEALPLVTYEVFLARDPFDPVVPEPVSQPDPDPSTPATPGPTNPTDPAVPVVPVVPSPTDPRCTGVQELVCDGRVVTLLDIAKVDGQDVAIIQIDTVVYQVRVGEVFAVNFQLKAIDPPTVSIVYGDTGFVLRAGDTVLK